MFEIFFKILGLFIYLEKGVKFRSVNVAKKKQKKKKIRYAQDM